VRRHFQVATIAFLTTCAWPSGAANEHQDARRWLTVSAADARAVEPGGVYEAYAAQRLALAQARAYALLGDVEHTIAHLPDLEHTRPSWSSDGDGAVRMLLVSLDLREINGDLIRVLVSSGRDDEALAYAARSPQFGNDPYLQLGIALGRQRAKSLPDFKGLNPDQAADIRVGAAYGLLEHGDAAHAERILAATTNAQARNNAVEHLGGILIATEQDPAALRRLLKIAALSGDRSEAILRDAISTAVRADDMDAAERLAKEVTDPKGRDAASAQLALGYLARGANRQAAALFDAARSRESSSWEHVAILLPRTDWLEARYAKIADPWRRTERLYQLAKQRLAAGERAVADRLAATAAKSARLISGDSTRWLVLKMLAEYHALAGAPDPAATFAALIPAGQRERAEADLQVAVAWARVGDVSAATQLINDLSDPVIRASALAAAAGAAHAVDQVGYRTLVSAAVGACTAINADEQERCWSNVVKMQLGTVDIDGARNTAMRAPEGSARAAALETVFDYHLKAHDLQRALDIARAIPGGMDPHLGTDRRANALALLVDTYAADGEIDTAAKLLAEIDQPVIRELHAAAVIAAMANAGRTQDALALVAGLRRRDAREQALALLFFKIAQRGDLPDATTLMSQVQSSRGGELCWVSAAAARNQDVATMDAWLQNLTDAACRAFAYAGAAYGAVAPAGDVSAESLFARVDPMRVEERMAKAMQIQAARMR
jgi:hypothetical protein